MNSEKNCPTVIALREDQVEHQEHDAGAQEVDRRALDEAEAAQVAHLLQLELQDLVGGRVQPGDLLLRRARGSSPARCCAATRSSSPASAVVSATITFWICLDAPAEHRAEDAEQRDGQEVDRRDQPVHAEGVDHHEDDADQRREQHVDRRSRSASRRRCAPSAACRASRRCADPRTPSRAARSEWRMPSE